MFEKGKTEERVPFRVGHADASADAHRMRINAHRCASSAYCAKNDIPFCTYKLPFWLRFSKSLGPDPHQLTNISYVESGEVLCFVTMKQGNIYTAINHFCFKLQRLQCTLHNGATRGIFQRKIFLNCDVVFLKKFFSGSV